MSFQTKYSASVSGFSAIVTRRKYRKQSTVVTCLDAARDALVRTQRHDNLFFLRNSCVTFAPNKPPAPREESSTPTKLSSGCGSDQIVDLQMRNSRSICTSYSSSLSSSSSSSSSSLSSSSSSGSVFCSTLLLLPLLHRVPLVLLPFSSSSTFSSSSFSLSIVSRS